MALTKVTSGLISADASSVDLNIDAGTLYIDSTNNRVGIGTTSPSTQLHVIGTSDATSGITIQSSRSGVGYTITTNNTNTGANKGSGIKFQSGGFDLAGIVARSDAIAATGDAPAYLTFHTSADGTEDLSERLRIDSSGNVGIGTSSASGILHLYKSSGTTDLRIQSNQYSANYGFVGGAVGTNALGIYDYGASAYRFVLDSSGNVGIGTTSPFANSITVARGAGVQASVEIAGNNTTAGSNGFSLVHGPDSTAYVYNRSNTPLIFATNDTERMRIDSSGKVGILTTSPTDYLTVKGNGQQLRLETYSDPSNYYTKIECDYSYAMPFFIKCSGGGGLKNVLSWSDGTGFYLYNIQSGSGNSTLKFNTSTGQVTYDTSSRLIKEQIENCPYGLNDIVQLQPRKYWRIDDERYEIGLIADEVVEVMPELVPTGEKSVITKNEEDTEIIPISINYEKIVSPLIQAIKELKSELDDAKARIQTLEGE